MKNFISKYKFEFGVIGLTLLMMYHFFGPYLWKPNEMMMAFGGDALVLYANTVYHACYGNGLILENMNYPYGELIFMTDAQGALSILLMWLKNLGINTCDCAVGVIHVLNHYSIIPATLLMYYVLVSLKVSKFNSMIFSVLIVFLSPQMFRFAAHYGLAYLFAIPMVMLFSLRKYRVGQWEKRDIIFFLILAFITFNNPYLGLISASIGILFGFIVLSRSLINKDGFKKAGYIPLILCTTAIVIPYFVIKYVDPITDRIALQWGFTTYATNLRGSLYPHNTLMNKMLSVFGVNVKPIEFEAIQYIGIVSVITLFMYLVYRLVNKKRMIMLEKPLGALFLSGVFIYIYSSNVNILGRTTVDFIEDKLGFLLMFKASGRIGWPFYFILTTIVVFILDQVLKRLDIKRKQFSFLALIPIVFIWFFEINMFIKPVYKDVFHANFLSKAKREEFKIKLDRAGFKASDYQALLCVPKTQFWSDKFLSYNHWPTHFYATLINLTYQIPMANALISRPGTAQNANGVQLLSHPLISREAPILYPNKKDILIVLGKEHPTLSIGEQHVVNISEKVYEDPSIVLYKMKYEDFFKNKYIEEAKQKFNLDSLESPLFHEGFDSYPSDERFYGDGSKLIKEGTHVVLDKSFSNKIDTVFNFSVWTKIDHKKYWFGDWIIKSFDKDNVLTEEVYINPRNSYDIQHQYVRAETNIKVKAEARIIVELIANQDLVIDELIIDFKGSNSQVYKEGNAYFLCNGYKILK